MPFLSGIEMSSSTTSNSGRAHQRDRLAAGGGFAGDFHVGLVGDELLQARAHDRVVVGNEDPDHLVRGRRVESTSCRPAVGTSWSKRCVRLWFIASHILSVAALVLGEPVVERLEADAQHFRAPPLVALAVVERGVDRLRSISASGVPTGHCAGRRR